LEYDEDEIDIKAVFATLYKYRYMILSLAFVAMLISGIYAYFKPSVYQATSTIEVSSEKKGFGGEDILAMATGAGSSSVDTEIEIIKSRFVAAMAVAKVDLAHRYYVIKYYKKRELYKNTPFEIQMTKGYGVAFHLYPIDRKLYRLVVNSAKDRQGNSWSYDKLHHYGEEIENEHFHFKLLIHGDMGAEHYSFTVMDPDKVASFTQKYLSVGQVSKKADIIKVSFEDNVAFRAQEYVNALSESYIRQSIDRKTGEATSKLDFIDRQLQKITQNLDHSAEKLEAFQENSNTVDLSAKAQSIITQMGDAESKLAEMSISLELLDSLYKQIKSGKNLETLSVAGLGGAEQATLGVKIKELQDSIIKKKILREDYTEAFPEVKKLRRQIGQLRKMIIATIKNMRISYREKKALIKGTIAKQQKLLNTLPASERIHGQLQRKFTVNEKIYSYLLEKRSETAIIKASTVSKNRVLDRALTPEKPIKPKKKLIVLVGLILGLILGIALAFLRDFLDDRIKSEEDISRETQISVLATIPILDDRNGTIPVFDSPKSAVAESFRNLRLNLQFMSKGKLSKVILLTSTVGGEGKTTNAVNLGAIMSMSRHKTIILNMDMRKPTLHKKFKLSNSKGMSTLLAGHGEVEEAIQHTSYEGLDIIASGPVPPNPSELIEGGPMDEIIKKLKQEYEVIILDTPPVGLVTDARVLMPFADNILYIMRAGYSKKEFLQAVKKLKEEGIDGFGILLNAVQLTKKGYGGYGYYEEGGR